jgi:hypothetical protein
MLIGEDDVGIAAVTLSWLGPRSAEQDREQYVKLQAIAIVARNRGQGGACADEALQTTLEAIAAQVSPDGITVFRAVGWIHPRNKASKLMCQRAGLIYLGEAPGELEEWGLTVDLTESSNEAPDPA